MAPGRLGVAGATRLPLSGPVLVEWIVVVLVVMSVAGLLMELVINARHQRERQALVNRRAHDVGVQDQLGRRRGRLWRRDR